MRIAIAVALTAGLILLLVQNASPIQLEFLVWSGATSAALPILAAYLIGGLTLRPLVRLLATKKQKKKD